MFDWFKRMFSNKEKTDGVILTDNQLEDLKQCDKITSEQFLKLRNKRIRREEDITDTGVDWLTAAIIISLLQDDSDVSFQSEHFTTIPDGSFEGFKNGESGGGGADRSFGDSSINDDISIETESSHVSDDSVIESSDSSESFDSSDNSCDSSCDCGDID